MKVWTIQLVKKGIGLPYFDVRSRSLSKPMNNKNQKTYQGKIVCFFFRVGQTQAITLVSKTFCFFTIFFIRTIYHFFNILVHFKLETEQKNARNVQPATNT